MLLQIPNVLSAEQLAQCRGVLETAAWVDGKATSGPLAAKAKDNMQIPEDDPEAKKLGDMILGALERNGLFMSAALPLRV